jgi:ATP synthase F1 delta subunit
MNVSFERLYERAQKRSDLSELQNNLFGVYYLYRHNNQARKLLSHKAIQPAEKIEILKGLPGFKPSKTFDELLFLVLNQNELASLHKVNEGFNSFVEKKDNIIIVQVFSATELSESLETKITQNLEKVLNKKVLLKTFIDEKLIAGILIKLPGGKIYNFSLEKAISDFKIRLLEE